MSSIADVRNPWLDKEVLAFMQAVPVRYRNGIGRISVGNVTRAGRHIVMVRVSDYQEAKNMENTGPILPNTRTFSARFSVR